MLRDSTRMLAAASLLAITAAAPATAQTAATAWTPTAPALDGAARAGSREKPVLAGTETSIALQRLKPGSTVSVLNGTTLLTPEPMTVGEDGKLTVPVAIPADAPAGHYQLTIVTQNPATVSQVPLKVSEVVQAQGADGFKMQSADVGERAYQAALSSDGKLFVASARGPNEGSRLMRLDAATLAVEAEAEIAKDAKGEQIGVFGAAVDDANGKVWTTNTLNETIAVYNTGDMTLAKQFDEDLLPHPRDIVIDEANGRAYVSLAFTPFVEVFDTKTLEPVGRVEFVAERGTKMFGTIDLALDAQKGKLYSVSRDTPYVGWVDLASGESTVVKVPEAMGATDIAIDPATGRMYVVSQESDNVVTLDPEGKVLANTKIGAGGVSVVFDPKTSHVYAATRAGGTVAVLDADGKMVANLPADETPNHLSVGEDGSVYLVSMYGKPGDDDQTGSVTKINTVQ